MSEKSKNKPKRQKSQTVQTIKMLFVLIVGGFLVLSAVAYDRSLRDDKSEPSVNTAESTLIEMSEPCDSLTSQAFSINEPDAIAFEAALQSAHDAVLSVSYPVPDVAQYCYVLTDAGDKELDLVTVGHDLYIASTDPGSDAERAQIIMDVLPTVEAEKPIDFVRVQFNFYDGDTLVTQWSMPYSVALEAATQGTSAEELYTMGS